MSTRGYKCPCCSGSLVFSSDTQKLQCPSCDHEIDMDTVRQYAEIVESVEAQGIHLSGRMMPGRARLNGE